MRAPTQEQWWQGTLLATLVGGLLLFSSGLFHGVWAWLLVLPWVASLALWGLPHGAVDHFMLARLIRPGEPGRYVIPSALVYLVVVLMVFGLWFWIPEVAFVGFIGLTLVHWGCGDLWWSWTRDPTSFLSLRSKVFFLLWRGALPMLLPLVFDQKAYRAVAEVASGWWKGGQDWGWLESPNVRFGAAGLCLILGLASYLTTGGWRGSKLNRREDVALIAFFACLPALPAVGLYFSFWHGWRHVLRLQGRASGKIEESMSHKFWAEAWPTTVVSFLFLIGLAVGVPHRETPTALLGVYLVLISCLTVPHAAVVTWMDLKSGLWANFEK